MSYQSKRNLVMMATQALVFGAYCFYAFPRLGVETPLRTWALTMLTFMGIMIAATIIIQIMFHILLSVGVAAREAIRNHNVDEDTIGQAVAGEFVEDERDRLIALKSSQVGFYISGTGLIAGLIALALGLSPVVMLNILFAAFFLGSLAEGIANLAYYCRSGSHA
jgi:hypothetical protein